MKCLVCGCEDEDFIQDYYWSENEDEELPSFVCFKCGNDQDDLFEDI